MDDGANNPTVGNKRIRGESLYLLHPELPLDMGDREVEVDVAGTKSDNFKTIELDERKTSDVGPRMREKQSVQSQK